jgi:methionine salvage enolase-phosphatase E1
LGEDLVIFEEPSAIYESITSRMRALAVVYPVLALDASKAKKERGWDTYRMAELALAAIDFVTLRTDMRTAVRQETVVEHVAEFAALQQPGRTGEEYRAVARWVTERLINTEERDRAFRHAVGYVTDNGFETREASFQILKEVPDHVGQAALIATDAAITVLVHAIDVDIASEQIAAEAKLEALLKRSRISEAWQAAHNARIQSIRYAKDIHGRIEAMKRNVRAVDWDTEVRDTVDEALEHVRSRSAAETKHKERVNQLLEATADERKRRQLQDLDALIHECWQRHAVLIDMLMTVGPEFRRQQDRQVFVAPAIHTRVHLHEQLLQPVLELSLNACLGPLEAFTRAVMGPVRPRVMYLPDFLEGLTRVAEEAGGELVPVQNEYDWSETDGPPAFSEEQHYAVDALLAAITDQGVRLSTLLAATRQPGPGTGPESGTDELLTLRTQQLFRLIPVRQLVDGEAAVVAVDDGTVLDDVLFGGSDFLLVRTGGVSTSQKSQTNAPLPTFPAPRRPQGPDAHQLDQESA